MKSTIVTRTARLEDLEVLYGFEQGIIEAERPFDPCLKSGHFNYYDIKAMILAEDVEVVVAVDGEELVASGYAKIQPSKPYLIHDEHAYVGFMFVKPTHRGRRVSQKILAHLKTWAKSKNLTEMQLDVYAENSSAVRAYENAGFKPNLVNMRMEI